MNGILIAIILSIILYFIYQKFKIKIYDLETIKLGLLKNDYNIKKYGFLLKKQLSKNIEIIIYDDYKTLM